MSDLQVGQPAPDFTLPAADGNVTLSDFRGKKNVILYFYPKDDTPGCTTEACGFRDLKPAFAAADTVVLGVNPDDAKSHEKFASKFSLNFPLLADEGAQVCDQYGVWKEKSNYGKTSMGVERSTFAIDKQGILQHIERKVKVEGHMEAMLELARKL